MIQLFMSVSHELMLKVPFNELMFSGEHMFFAKLRVGPIAE
jgi:hypothetical protein